MSRATVALPPGLRRSKRRAVAARHLPRPQPLRELNEDDEPDTENESDETEGLQAGRVEPTFEGLSDVRCESTYEGLSDLRCEPDPGQGRRQHQPTREALGRERELRGELLTRPWVPWPFGPERELGRGEVRERGEPFHSGGAVFEGSFFEGPDMKDAEVRATVGFLTSTLRIQPFNPEAPDMWVESISDALYAAGMSAVFLAADCRDKDEVPVRVRNAVELIPPWKLAFAWTTIRRSLQSVPAVYNRTQKGAKGNLP